MFHICVAYYFITTENRHHQRRFLNLKCVQNANALAAWALPGLWGLCPDSAGRAYSSSPDPLAGFGGEGRGLGMKNMEMEWGKDGEREGRGGRRGEGGKG